MGTYTKGTSVSHHKQEAVTTVIKHPPSYKTLFLVYISNHCTNMVCIVEEKGQMEIYRREFEAQRQTRSPGEMGREEDIIGVWQLYIGRSNFLKGGMTTL